MDVNDDKNIIKRNIIIRAHTFWQWSTEMHFNNKIYLKFLLLQEEELLLLLQLLLILLHVPSYSIPFPLNVLPAISRYIYIAFRYSFLDSQPLKLALFLHSDSFQFFCYVIRCNISSRKRLPLWEKMLHLGGWLWTVAANMIESGLLKWA